MRRGAQILPDRGRPRSAVVVGEVRAWLTALRDLPDQGGKRRVLVRCALCDRDVAVSLDTWKAMRERTLADAPETCRHQLGAVQLEHDTGGGRPATTAHRVRAVLEDLADVGEVRAVALRAEVEALRARARELRAAPGGMHQARAADACARLLEYAAGAPEALRLVAREGR